MMPSLDHDKILLLAVVLAFAAYHYPMRKRKQGLIIVMIDDLKNGINVVSILWKISMMIQLQEESPAQGVP
jgi:hypothetical protein